MRNLTILLAIAALLASGCAVESEALESEAEPTDSVSQKITACGFPEYRTAICDRMESLGTCTEFRCDQMDKMEARTVCESSGGRFQPGASCPRQNDLLGACPSEEKPGELRLHYYYAGQVFADDGLPKLACSALSEGSWCSGR
jgi:hypothetical protein